MDVLGVTPSAMPAVLAQSVPLPAAPVIVAQPVAGGGAVGPIVVPAMAAEAPSPAPVPTAGGGGPASLLGFLEKVRLQQYLAPLLELGASEPGESQQTVYI